MSGIVGIIYPDNRSVESKLLEQMTAKLAHRGPDGIDIWHQGGVGLGHLMLRTTPESVWEQLPLVNARGDLVLTADARIDNRDELIGSLKLEGDVTDSQIILAAYEKWGTSCCEYLIGDFAFALWDDRQQRLFCGRDRLGVRPFFYYHSPEVFIFASEIKALFCLPKVPKQLYEPWVATHLTLVDCHEPGTTFYKDIKRLLPAHQLIFSDNRIHLETYWQLDPTKNIELRSDAEYAEAFQEIFTEAVRCRLRTLSPDSSSSLRAERSNRQILDDDSSSSLRAERSNRQIFGTVDSSLSLRADDSSLSLRAERSNRQIFGTVGSMLSGGLDSSAVTCVAGKLLAQNQQQPLYTYSAFFAHDIASDERPYTDAVIAQGNFIPYRVDGNQVSSNSDIETIFWHLDEPFWYPFLLVNWQLYKQARSQGVRVLLDGIDGDTTVADCRNSYLKELLFTRRWRQLLAEIEGMSGRFGDSRLGNLKQHVLSPLLKQPTLKVWDWLRGEKPWKSGLINPDFARKMEIDRHFQLEGGYAWQPTSNARETHYRMFAHYPTILELLNKSGAAFGMEYRHPFTDKRLVEFCLAVPAEQKFHQGVTRAVMRRGLADFLPENVQQRRGKSGIAHQYIRNSFIAPPTDWGQVILNDVKSLEAYVKMSKLREMYHGYLDLKQEKFSVGVCHSASLALWLYQAGF